MTREINNWQAIQSEVLERIHNRTWKPGDLIPNEADLALEFGCSRSTVNRALRELAETGLLDRRRKAGTRVTMHPVRKATLRIPVIRREIEAKGHSYGYALIQKTQSNPPREIRARMQLATGAKTMGLVCLHLADGKPYVLEDRWINVDAVPTCTSVDFSVQNANEWLVENAPFTRGDISFSAVNAGQLQAEILACEPGDAVFSIERRTWNSDTAITSVLLIFAPGYRMHTDV